MNDVQCGVLDKKSAIRSSYLTAATVLLCGTLATGQELPDPEDFKPGEGRDVVVEHCTKCHDPGLITSAEMTRPQWERTVRTMVEEQGMVEPSEEVRKVILDYLEKTQSPGGVQRGDRSSCPTPARTLAKVGS